MDKIFLIGFMGCGKSTVGKILADMLDRKFIDLDSSIEISTNRSIDEIFNEDGEEAFREIEKQMLHKMQSRDSVVIATGGGCPAYSDNMEWMNQNGITVYLKTHPGILFHRLAPEKHKRPLIAQLPDVDLMEFILEKIKKRLLFYIKAEITVNGEGDPVNIAKNIAEKITSLSPDYRR